MADSQTTYVRTVQPATLHPWKYHHQWFRQISFLFEQLAVQTLHSVSVKVQQGLSTTTIKICASMDDTLIFIVLAFGLHFLAASNFIHVEASDPACKVRSPANARARELYANKSEETKEDIRRRDRERKALKRANEAKLMASAIEVTPYGSTINTAALKALHDKREHAKHVHDMRYEKNRKDPKWLDKSSMQRRIRAVVKANKEHPLTTEQLERAKAIEIDSVLQKGHLDEQSLRDISEKTFKKYGKTLSKNASSS